MTETQGLQIIELRKQGLGYKQIAGIVNISRDSVRSYCRVRNLTGYIAYTKNAKEKSLPFLWQTYRSSSHRQTRKILS